MDDRFPSCDVLREMLETRVVRLPDGGQKRLMANINLPAARALHDCILREKPAVMVEVGMAQGVSTLTSLSALSRVGGRLISIDPYFGWKSGRDAALHSVERAGFRGIHRHIEAPSFEALPGLLASGVQVDFAYIDGAHDFGNAFIDAFYLDRLLGIGGIMGFNDAGWPDVHRVIGFLKKHRSYDEFDVGLRKTYRGRNFLYSAARWILRRAREDRYFRKRGEDAEGRPDRKSASPSATETAR